MRSSMKVKGLFLDYDGTISPLDAAREESRTLEGIDAVLY